MCVNCSRVTIEVITPDILEDLISAHNLSLMGCKKMEDLNFLRCARDNLALDLDLIIVEIDLKTFESQDIGNLRRLIASPEYGLDPRDYFTR